MSYVDVIARPGEHPSRDLKDVQVPATGKNVVGDVLYSIASEDEDGRSRQRILAFAAKR
jgi:hypothetical protein